MPSLETLLLNFSPGPSNFYVMARAISQGPGAGALAALGLALGGLVHVLATALGISALFAVSPLAYTALKLAGAGYLVWLGVRYWRSGGDAVAPDADVRRIGRGAILRQSALVEITNPKTALFFIAFLPQFVDLTRGPPAPQLLLLGLIVTLSAIPCDLLVARLSGQLGAWMRDNSGWRRRQSRLSGALLVGLGAWLAFDADV